IHRRRTLARAGVQVNIFDVRGIGGHDHPAGSFSASPGDGDGVLACGKIAGDVGAGIAGDGLPRSPFRTVAPAPAFERHTSTKRRWSRILESEQSAPRS